MKPIVLLLSLFFSASALAFETGNELLDALRSNNSVRSLGAMQFVHGVVVGWEDAAAYGKMGKSFCRPSQGMTVKQGGDLVAMHIEQNPSTRHNSASTLVVVAMIYAYPCAK